MLYGITRSTYITLSRPLGCFSFTVGKRFDDGRSPLLVQRLSENFPDFTPNQEDN
jgi:hypothetical protein